MLERMSAWRKRVYEVILKWSPGDYIGFQPGDSDRLRYLRKGREDHGKGLGEWCGANACPNSTKTITKPQ